MPFFILFVVIPLAELFVFMKVSALIGLGTALFMALFTAILGGALVRHQGIQTLMQAQTNLRSGALPSKELFDGFCIIAAGATLITPGFITDAIGFALLIPPLRDALRNQISHKFKIYEEGYAPYQSPYNDDGDIIDVEYTTVKTVKDISQEEKKP